VDKVWRRRRVKLELEEEAPSIVREVDARRSGGATWGRGGAVARWDFRAAADLRQSMTTSWWYYSMRRKKGRLDFEESTPEWLTDAAHRRGKLGDSGGSDSGVGSSSLAAGADKRSSGAVGLSFGASERKEVEREAHAHEWGKVGRRGHR
jgi:hypothetical protein